MLFYLGFVALFLGLVAAGGILIVIGGFSLARSDWVRKQFTLPSVGERIAEQERQDARANAVLASATMQQAVPLFAIGEAINPGLIPDHIGIVVRAMTCFFIEALLDRMILILGEIGSGKTTGCLTIVQQVARYTGRDIYYINFKGDDETDRKVQRILYPYRGYVPIITIDPLNPKTRYNPFKYGDGHAIANRWIRILGIQDMEGNAEHYADLHRACIFLICLWGEPPRTLKEMTRRLEPSGTWFNQAYPVAVTKGQDGKKKTIPAHPDRWQVDLLLKKDSSGYTPLQKLAVKVIPFLKQLEHFISEDGWTPDDGSFILSVPSAMYPDTAQRVADVFVADTMHFMHPASHRQKGPVFLCWDEFQSASNKEITGILSQGRQFKCGVLLATQDINKLGPILDQKKLTSDTTTMIGFRTEQSAEFLADHAGTVKRPFYTAQIEDGLTGTKGSVREEHEYAVSPNDIARQPDGYAFVIRQRTHCQVLFNLPEIPDDVPPEPTPPPPAPLVQPPEEVKPAVIEH